ncbi:MAG: redoxin, partial [Bacteroidota bacterium]|nr:redoxin [Bacteroidota bacterium]
MMHRGLFFGLLLMIGNVLLADEPEPLAIGEKAPSFSLIGIDELNYTLESFSQAAVLTIVFTANHCPTAQAYEERLKELSAAYSSEEMMLVAISSNY